MIADLAEYAERNQKTYDKMKARYPDLHFITLTILAGDYANVPIADKAFEDGMGWKDVVWSVLGSYSRMEWVLEKVLAGRIPPRDFYKELPHLWAMSDPDDTDPRFLQMWLKAFYLNGSGYLRDGRKMRSGTTLTVYRGQQNEDGKFGLSWSLSHAVAERFARGAWHRVPTEGVIYVAQVRRNSVMAYLTDRQEEEVIINPDRLRNPEVFARIVRKESHGKEE